MENVETSDGNQTKLNRGPESDSIATYYLLIGVGVLLSIIPLIGAIGFFIVFIGFILLFMKRHAMGELQHRLLTFDIVLFILSLFIIFWVFVSVVFATVFSSVSATGTANSTMSATMARGILNDLLALIIPLELVPFGLCYLLMGVGIVESIQRRIFSLMIILGIAASVIGSYIAVESINVSSIVQASSQGKSLNTTSILSSSIYGSLSVLGIASSLLIGLAFVYLWKVVREGYGDVENLTSLNSGEPY